MSIYVVSRLKAQYLKLYIRGEKHKFADKLFKTLIMHSIFSLYRRNTRLFVLRRRRQTSKRHTLKHCLPLAPTRQAPGLGDLPSVLINVIHKHSKSVIPIKKAKLPRLIFILTPIFALLTVNKYAPSGFY